MSTHDQSAAEKTNTSRERNREADLDRITRSAQQLSNAKLNEEGDVISHRVSFIGEH